MSKQTKQNLENQSLKSGSDLIRKWEQMNRHKGLGYLIVKDCNDLKNLDRHDLWQIIIWGANGVATAWELLQKQGLRKEDFRDLLAWAPVGFLEIVYSKICEQILEREPTVDDLAAIVCYGKIQKYAIRAWEQLKTKSPDSENLRVIIINADTDQIKMEAQRMLRDMKYQKRFAICRRILGDKVANSKMLRAYNEGLKIKEELFDAKNGNIESCEVLSYTILIMGTIGAATGVGMGNISWSVFGYIEIVVALIFLGFQGIKWLIIFNEWFRHKDTGKIAAQVQNNTLLQGK